MKSFNAYGLSDFAGWSTNLYRPVDVAAPSPTFFTGGSLQNPLLTHKPSSAAMPSRTPWRCWTTRCA
jgi:hypothetical protein